METPPLPALPVRPVGAPGGAPAMGEAVEGSPRPAWSAVVMGNVATPMLLLSSWRYGCADPADGRRAHRASMTLGFSITRSIAAGTLSSCTRHGWCRPASGRSAMPRRRSARGRCCYVVGAVVAVLGVVLRDHGERVVLLSRVVHVEVDDLLGDGVVHRDVLDRVGMVDN
jgi:hypothetical protein